LTAIYASDVATNAQLTETAILSLQTETLWSKSLKFGPLDSEYLEVEGFALNFRAKFVSLQNQLRVTPVRRILKAAAGMPAAAAVADTAELADAIEVADAYLMLTQKTVSFVRIKLKL